MGETGEPVAVISGRHKKKLLSRADAMWEAGDLGGYQRNIDALAAGSWRYRWFATGNGQSSQSSGFTVKTPKTV